MDFAPAAVAIEDSSDKTIEERAAERVTQVKRAERKTRSGRWQMGMKLNAKCANLEKAFKAIKGIETVTGTQAVRARPADSQHCTILI